MNSYLEAYDELDYQKQLMDEFYDDEMSSKVDEAVKKVSLELVNPFHAKFYAEAIALAFFEGVDDSKIVLDKYNFDYTHVYALLDMKDRFIRELDKINGR